MSLCKIVHVGKLDFLKSNNNLMEAINTQDYILDDDHVPYLL